MYSSRMRTVRCSGRLEAGSAWGGRLPRGCLHPPGPGADTPQDPEADTPQDPEADTPKTQRQTPRGHPGPKGRHPLDTPPDPEADTPPAPRGRHNPPPPAPLQQCRNVQLQRTDYFASSYPVYFIIYT